MAAASSYYGPPPSSLSARRGTANELYHSAGRVASAPMHSHVVPHRDTSGADDDGLVFYGALACRVIAENTAAVGATGPPVRGRVDPARGHAVLDVVDAQVFIGGTRAPDAIAVRCTLRALVVLGVSLADVTDVRRAEGGTALEVDFCAPEDSAGLGRLRRRHTLIVQSSRRDRDAVSALYYAVVKAQRHAAQGPAAAFTAGRINPAAPGDPYNPATAALTPCDTEDASFHHHGHGESHHHGFDTPASIAAAAELARIQERRRQRQRLLVGDLLAVHGRSPQRRVAGGAGSHQQLQRGGYSGDAAAFFGSTGAYEHEQHGLRAAAVRAEGASHELQWCRWCNDFQPGQRHALTCPSRPVECSWCSRRMTHGAFETHQYECRDMPDFERAAEQRRKREEAEWRKISKRADKRRGAGDSGGDDSSDGSETESERRRRRRRERREREERERAALAASQQQQQAAAASAGGKSEAQQDEDDFERYGRRCIWCKKPRPKSHDPKCPSRRVVCKACHEQVLYREKDAHRLTCRKRPSRSAAEALGKVPPRRSSFAAGESSGDESGGSGAGGKAVQFASDDSGGE